MTKEELKKLIAFHESRLNYAKSQLENHIHDMYSDDIDRWLDELSKEQKIISWLKSLYK